MAYLYIDSKGRARRRHSYSAGNIFDQCALKYKLKYVLGWREAEDKARFLFGRALEEAIEYYHDHNGQGAVEDFQLRWAAHKDKPLAFTKVEVDWANCNQIGIEMLQMYAIRQPSLPIPLGGRSVFQREYTKVVFPDDPNYGEIEDFGKLDIVCYVDPHHPMLAHVEWKPEYGALRPLIVDIKTAGQNLPENPGIAAFDKQGRRYSWLSGIRDFALLWFTKTGRTLRKGSSVTLLVDSKSFKAGEEAVVAKVDGDNVYLLRNDYMLEEMENAQGKKADGKTDQTNAAKARAQAWLESNADYLPAAKITRQRLQFNSGFVTPESAEEAGQIAARQIVGIVNAYKTNNWPNTFGIRYPNDDRADAYFRAFVMRDEQVKQTKFTQSTEESFEDIQDDEPAEEQ